MNDALFIGLGIVGLPLLLVVVLYNGLVNKRNQANYAFSCIDVQLKKRWDLVPQLVNTVKGYAKHEQAVLERVTQARQQAMEHGERSDSRFRGENQLSNELPTLLALSESYPDLKANEQFLWLQRNLTEIEAQVSAARRAYNASVMELNNSIEMFPTSLIASMFKFERASFFEIDASEKGAQHVSL